MVDTTVCWARSCVSFAAIGIDFVVHRQTSLAPGFAMIAYPPYIMLNLASGRYKVFMGMRHDWFYRYLILPERPGKTHPISPVTVGGITPFRYGYGGDWCTVACVKA